MTSWREWFRKKRNEASVAPATESELTVKVRRQIEVYREALHYLKGAPRFDSSVFERLDKILEPVGAALGPQKRKQMLDTAIFILPDPDIGRPGGVESIRTTN